ncbi:MAG: hypothetical protein A2283_20945 [Lentisphaerae bacterium RIFOXYA12_FULL_48_11]|nr:MAG: hypothetical protein A2283_20945 [Lentisphaerae bacterium RIFOXYA12_FULL_48_11]
MKNTETATAVTQTLQRVGHCLYRSDKSDVYYAILKRGCKQIKRSLKTTDRTLAQRRLSELQDKASRLNQSQGGRILFEELGKRWQESAGTGLKPSSARRLVVAVKGLNKYFGKMMVRGITKAHIEKWAAQRSVKAAARTFNQERATLSRVFVYAMRDGIVLDNPVEIVKRMKPSRDQIVIPSKEQFKKLIKAIEALQAAHEAKKLCELLAYSGCRLGEAVAMCWGDINFERRQFTVTGGEQGTKNHEVRTVPLFPSLEALLLRIRESRGDMVKQSDRIIHIDNAKTALSSACRDAGLPHFTHHNFRHFFCSNAIEAGVDFKAIAGWLGHKDGGVLVAKTYGHLRDEHSAAMAKRITFNVTE